ncbi:MAG: hypothetical protein LC749_22265 [Actinobacteria bacterium]|nr:hypothetical protein [Actinomycetota bacterium]
MTTWALTSVPACSTCWEVSAAFWYHSMAWPLAGLDIGVADLAVVHRHRDGVSVLSSTASSWSVRPRDLLGGGGDTGPQTDVAQDHEPRGHGRQRLGFLPAHLDQAVTEGEGRRNCGHGSEADVILPAEGDGEVAQRARRLPVRFPQAALENLLIGGGGSRQVPGAGTNLAALVWGLDCSSVGPGVSGPGGRVTSS